MPTLFLTLYFCTKQASGPCVAVHPPAYELHSLVQCRLVGQVLARDWLRRHDGYATLGGSCDPREEHFHNEMPWS
jgi:hypothetical protein